MNSRKLALLQVPGDVLISAIKEKFHFPLDVKIENVRWNGKNKVLEFIVSSEEFPDKGTGDMIPVLPSIKYKIR